MREQPSPMPEQLMTDQPIEAVVAAYGPRDPWEAAQIAKAVELDRSVIALCRLLRDPSLPVEQRLAAAQEAIATDRSARLIVAGVERRRTRAIKQAAEAARPAPAPRPDVAKSEAAKAAPLPPAPLAAKTRTVSPPFDPILNAATAALWDRSRARHNARTHPHERLPIASAISSFEITPAWSLSSHQNSMSQARSNSGR